ncbi:hypothetical protein J1605_015742 [Eschrichtius robustus]|uniref:Uncharacterized protein n=1 Tax=Eschrichtius robustus TaxID=9764 RepID=A0AB34GB05_ESCRO|nr:hypothetical protein J1605_015742 [Eschrichtius robustus]
MPRPQSPSVPTPPPAHARRLWPEPPLVSVARLPPPLRPSCGPSTCRLVCPGAGAPDSVGAREGHGFPARVPCDQLAAVFVPGADYSRPVCAARVLGHEVLGSPDKVGLRTRPPAPLGLVGLLQDPLTSQAPSPNFNIVDTS